MPKGFLGTLGSIVRLLRGSAAILHKTVSIDRFSIRLL
jgi:hypothetical protein